MAEALFPLDMRAYGEGDVIVPKLQLTTLQGAHARAEEARMKAERRVDELGVELRKARALAGELHEMQHAAEVVRERQRHFEGTIHKLREANSALKLEAQRAAEEVERLGEAVLEGMRERDNLKLALSAAEKWRGENDRLRREMVLLERANIRLVEELIERKQRAMEFALEG